MAEAINMERLSTNTVSIHLHKHVFAKSFLGDLMQDVTFITNEIVYRTTNEMVADEG